MSTIYEFLISLQNWEYD